MQRWLQAAEPREEASGVDYALIKTSAALLVYQTSHRYSWVVEALHLFKYVLPLAMFGGAPYSCDETSVVKCVFKPRCGVGIRLRIADKMSVDLCYVDRRAHEPTGERGLFRRGEC